MTETKKYRSVIELSIRRKDIKGLPGDDSTLHNLKVGASLKGNGPLRGLTYDEEIKYLPEIIGVSPQDNEWRRTTKEYWYNVSVPIPADGLTAEKLQGRPIKFTVEFNNASDKESFEKVISFEEKAKASKKGEVIEGVGDYILWRYCLVYSRVANRYEDVRKSPKILFYLYSKENETLVEHTAFKSRIKAQNMFTKILMEENVINAVLLMFDQDLSAFDTLQDKHLALEAFIKNKPMLFIKYMEDENLVLKSTIKKAVDNKIIHKPANTDSYYFGENNEVVLGHTLMDATLFFKSKEQKNIEVVSTINARLKQL